MCFVFIWIPAKVLSMTNDKRQTTRDKTGTIMPDKSQHLLSHWPASLWQHKYSVDRAISNCETTLLTINSETAVFTMKPTWNYEAKPVIFCKMIVRFNINNYAMENTVSQYKKSLHSVEPKIYDK